ncbi:phage tail protein [Streptomyces calidiresistens]|uniref:Phage tail protein n=2 Tax=Streptomyces TaxID=1883 RepID=A0A7W3TDL1_9ACTN|nr:MULTISPECIES: phage tail protein [Streptomyces]MBB0230317.1 phage tail protein [Streptomyces calidiresistens]MBB0244908.1 phage tail protein [Streptomyces alkaliphilus]
MSVLQDPATTPFFRLTIDGDIVGDFNKVDGLAVRMETEQYQEGGNNGYAWQLPTRITFSTIRLTRPVTEDSARIAKWISSVQTGIVRPTGAITALLANGTEIVTWGLLDVLPVGWTGPDFDPEGNSVAVEVLEIAHHGFTD